MPKKKTVLVVVAHADDLEFMAGGTVARFVEEKGYPVYEYILTDNSKGSYRIAAQDLIGVSAREAQAAAEVLALTEVRLEGYPDGCLNEENPNIIRGKIMAMIREVKADIVMSWDPFAPLEEHPDHRVVGMATLEAASFSGIPLYHPEHRDPPYMATEAYWFAKAPWNADLIVDISCTIDKKLRALLKHECQMDLTVDGLRAEADTLGISLSLAADESHVAQHALVDAAMRRLCAEVGRPTGMAHAERFRYQRLGMLDLLLGEPAVQPDF